MKVLLRAMAPFVVVFLTVAVGCGYMALFSDEIDPKHPANVGGGPLAPMYRRWVDFVLVNWIAFSTTTVAYYMVFGGQTGIKINWSVARFWFFWLHFFSGVLILTSLLLAVAIGQPIHLRDIITAIVGLAALAFAVWERTNRQEDLFPGDTSPVARTIVSLENETNT